MIQLCGAADRHRYERRAGDDDVRARPFVVPYTICTVKPIAGEPLFSPHQLDDDPTRGNVRLALALKRQRIELAIRVVT